MNNTNDIRNMPYAEWLEKTLQELVNFPVKGICIAATTNTGEFYVNYHNVPMGDKLTIAGLVNQDAMLDTMAANGLVEYVEDEEGGDDNGEEEV